MVQQITVDGHKQLAVTMKGLNNLSDIIEMQSAIAELLETCLSTDETKDRTSSFSLWFALQFITELSADIQEMQKQKGGQS